MILPHRSVLRLKLELRPALLDPQLDLEALRAAALARAADRRRSEIIEPDGDAHMRLGGRNPVRRIEPDPAEIRYLRFSPSVPGILLDDAIGTEEVARHVAGRNAEITAGGDEDMSQVLADAAPQREGLPGGRRDMGRLGVEGRLAVHAVEETVQGREGIGRDVAGDIGRELGDRRVGGGEIGLAQIEQVRDALDRAAQDAAGVAGLDLSCDPHRDALDGAVGREHVKDVTERILARLQPPVDARLDAPAADVLPIVIARRQAQRLNERPDGPLVAVGRVVGDSDAHRADVTGAGPRASTAARFHTRYCSAIAIPSLLFSSMNSLMNSCSPASKMPSMRAPVSFASMLLARRWRGPRRP